MTRGEDVCKKNTFKIKVPKTACKANHSSSSDDSGLDSQMPLVML